MAVDPVGVGSKSGLEDMLHVLREARRKKTNKKLGRFCRACTAANSSLANSSNLKFSLPIFKDQGSESTHVTGP